MLPSMRYIGGTPAVMCRSDARFGTISSSSWRRVTTLISPGSRVRSRERRGPRFRPSAGPISDGGLLLVGRRLLEHFLHRGEPALELLERVPPQRQHSLLHRELLELARGGAVEHQLAQRGGESHDLVHALPAAVAGVVALHAACALHEIRALGVRLR